MSERPLVSIIIPVYNGSNYLDDAIKSALAQEYPNIEVLVINDGSNDKGLTRDIALSYGTSIRYFEKENGGVSSALNVGIHKMRGEYFSWLSHDDLYTDDKIEVQVSYLENSELDCCYSDYYSFGEKIDEAQKIECDEFRMPESLFKLFGVGYIMGCTFLIRKKVFEEVGLFREDLKYTQDVEMWIRIFTNYKSHKINRYLVYQRGHVEQGSQMFKIELNEEVRQMYMESFFTENVLSHFKSYVSFDGDNIEPKAYSWLGNRLLLIRKDCQGFFKMYTKAIKLNNYYIIDFIKKVPLFFICIIRDRIKSMIYRNR